MIKDAHNYTPDADDEYIRAAIDKALSVYIARAKEHHAAYVNFTAAERDQAVALLKVIRLAALAPNIPDDHPAAVLVANTKALGITHAIRQVMKVNFDGLTPIEVRDGLVKLGYDLSSYKNIQSTIHTILKRLEQNGEVKRYEDKTRKPTNVYFWTWLSKENIDALNAERARAVDTKKIATKKKRSSKKKK